MRVLFALAFLPGWAFLRAHVRAEGLDKPLGLRTRQESAYSTRQDAEGEGGRPSLGLEGIELPKYWTQRSKKERQAIKKRQRQIKALVDSLKSGPCADCGHIYPLEAMDFDHVPGRGGKLGSVGSRGSERGVLYEARKCDVVCSNCHRVRTRRRKIGKQLERKERARYLDGIVEALEREREALRASRQPDPSPNEPR